MARTFKSCDRKLDCETDKFPILKVDSTAFRQSPALLRFAASLSGLCTPDLQLQIDGVEESLADIINALMQWYKGTLGRNPMNDVHSLPEILPGIQHGAQGRTSELRAMVAKVEAKLRDAQRDSWFRSS